MKYFTSLTYFIFAFSIDTSNVFVNIFIIYGLQKLKKLSNISFWLIYWLSISDLFVGLSGFTLDISYVSCLTRLNCYWLRYFFEVRAFFLGYSVRLTIIIAIDRSIRMKYLLKYNSIMTKTKANIVLIVNGILGIINCIGNLGPHRITFEMAYGTFHAICIVSGCMLYIITYCNTQEKISGLQWKVQRRQIITVNEARSQSNVPAPPSQHDALGTAEGISIEGITRGKSRSLTTLHSSRHQERDNERNRLSVPGKVSVRSKSLSNGIPEISIKINISSNDDAIRYAPSRNSSMFGQDNGNQQHSGQILIGCWRAPQLGNLLGFKPIRWPGSSISLPFI